MAGKRRNVVFSGERLTRSKPSRQEERHTPRAQPSGWPSGCSVRSTSAPGEAVAVSRPNRTTRRTTTAPNLTAPAQLFFSTRTAELRSGPEPPTLGIAAAWTAAATAASARTHLPRIRHVRKAVALARPPAVEHFADLRSGARAALIARRADKQGSATAEAN